MKIIISYDNDLEMTEIACTGIETISDIIDLCGISKMLGEGISSFTTADECTGIRIYSNEYDNIAIEEILKEELRIFNFEFTDDFFQRKFILPNGYGEVIFDIEEEKEIATIILLREHSFLELNKVYNFLDEAYVVEIVAETKNFISFQVSDSEFDDKKGFVKDIIECLEGRLK